MWHKLKEFNRREVKHQMTSWLLGIMKFWDTVTVEKCQKYINDLKKVILKVIELNGAASDYHPINGIKTVNKDHNNHML